MSEQKVYISERALQFSVPKIGKNGLKIPLLNDFGNPKPGEFEMHVNKFTPFEIKKIGGEQMRTFVFIVDDNTPPEVAEWVEKKILAQGECETQEVHIQRTNPTQAAAEKALKESRDENTKNKDALEKTQAELEALKKKFHSRG